MNLHVLLKGESKYGQVHKVFVMNFELMMKLALNCNFLEVLMMTEFFLKDFLSAFCSRLMNFWGISGKISLRAC